MISITLPAKRLASLQAMAWRQVGHAINMVSDIETESDLRNWFNTNFEQIAKVVGAKQDKAKLASHLYDLFKSNDVSPRFIKKDFFEVIIEAVMIEPTIAAYAMSQFSISEQLDQSRKLTHYKIVWDKKGDWTVGPGKYERKNKEWVSIIPKSRGPELEKRHDLEKLVRVFESWFAKIKKA